MRPLTPNIVAVYERATSEQRARGLEWYRDAHAHAVTLDPRNPARAAGVIAALSPMIQWERNLQLAYGAYSRGRAYGTFARNVRKAQAILDGADPLEILGGHKVRAFYASIVAPDGHEVVCIDRHAHDIAIGRRCADETRVNLGAAHVYDAFARAYVRAARRLNVPPSHVQAVTWVVWRDQYRGSRS